MEPADIRIAEHFALRSALTIADLCGVLRNGLELPEFVYSSENETEWGTTLHEGLEYNSAPTVKARSSGGTVPFRPTATSGSPSRFQAAARTQRTLRRVPPNSSRESDKNWRTSFVCRFITIALGLAQARASRALASFIHVHSGAAEPRELPPNPRPEVDRSQNQTAFRAACWSSGAPSFWSAILVPPVLLMRPQPNSGSLRGRHGNLHSRNLAGGDTMGAGRSDYLTRRLALRWLRLFGERACKSRVLHRRSGASASRPRSVSRRPPNRLYSLPGAHFDVPSPSCGLVTGWAHGCWRAPSF